MINQTTFTWESFIRILGNNLNELYSVVLHNAGICLFGLHFLDKTSCLCVLVPNIDCENLALLATIS